MPRLNIERVRCLIDESRIRITELNPTLNDDDGTSTSFEAHDYEDLGLCLYIDRGDIAGFREHLARSIEGRISLARRKLAGEGISEAFVNDTIGVQLLTACASGKMDLAVEWASLVPPEGQFFYPRPPIQSQAPSRKSVVLPPKAIEDYINAFNRAIRALLIEDATHLNNALADAWTANGNMKDEQAPYLRTIEAVRDRNEKLFAESMAIQNAEHKKFARYGQLRSDLEEYISLKGIGWCNLARHFGMNAEGSAPYVPAELLIPLRVSSQ